MNITLAEAVKQLEDYTTEQIVELLTLAGKTGVRGDEHSCPMAHYFYDVLGRDCVVSNTATWVYEERDWDVDLPGGVRQFINQFDEGAYPHLIEDEDWDEEDDDE